MYWLQTVGMKKENMGSPVGIWGWAVSSGIWNMPKGLFLIIGEQKKKINRNNWQSRRKYFTWNHWNGAEIHGATTLHNKRHNRGLLQASFYPSETCYEKTSKIWPEWPTKSLPFIMLYLFCYRTADSHISSLLHATANPNETFLSVSTLLIHFLRTF